jgi:hypothetical protein
MEIGDDSNGIKRKYFVAFDYRKANDYGKANILVESKFPISGWDNILSITGYILSCNPDMEKIVISGWQKFEDPE